MSRTKRKPAEKANRQTFEEQAANPNAGLIAEFWEFFPTNKKWWLIPLF